MKKENINKILGLLIGLGMFGLIMLFATLQREKYLDEIDTINENCGFTKGLVIDKSTSKGRFIRVRYRVNGKLYVESDGNDTKDKVEEGDSIKIKYHKDNPQLMITQFNEKF